MLELFKSISKKEWFLVFGLSLVMMIITGLPYLYAYFNPPPGFIYNGLHSQTPGDVPVYYSYIKQVKDGNYFLKDLFTTENQVLGTFNIFWSAVGIFAKIFNLAPALAFHLSRLLLIPVLLLAIYLWLSWFFDDIFKRKVSFLLLVFGSGVGIYLAGPLTQILPFYQTSDFWPIDLWVTESNIFNTLYQSPHFIMSWALMLLILLLMFLALEKQKIFYAVLAGILGLIYFNFHPYYVLTVFGTLAIYLLFLFFKEKKFNWKDFSYLLIFLLISLPSVLYHYWLIKNEPVIGWRAAQNVTLITYFTPLIFGYGFFWLLADLGFLKIFQTKDFSNKNLFLISWLLMVLFLLFLPTPFQSRYTQGLELILVLLSVEGLYFISRFFKTKLSGKFYELVFKNKLLLVVLAVLLLYPSSLFNWTRDLIYFYKQNLPIFYLSKTTIDGFKWLDGLPADQRVLAGSFSSFFIPGYSGQTVYLAHKHETINSAPKEVLLFWFFSGNDGDQQKIKFLKENKIDYIFYSPEEKKMGEFRPAEKDYLELVYKNGAVEVYQVIDKK